MALPCSQIISENTRQRVLNLGCNIKKKNISLDLFFFIFLQEGKKKIQNLNKKNFNVGNQT
jgi:hypothetical protein